MGARVRGAEGAFEVAGGKAEMVCTLSRTGRIRDGRGRVLQRMLLRLCVGGSGPYCCSVAARARRRRPWAAMKSRFKISRAPRWATTMRVWLASGPVGFCAAEERLLEER